MERMYNRVMALSNPPRRLKGFCDFFFCQKWFGPQGGVFRIPQEEHAGRRLMKGWGWGVGGGLI